MKTKRIIIISIGVVLAVALAIFLITKNNGKEIEFKTAVATENTVEITVTATGYVQPVEKVEVGTQVSGVIEKIYVDFNSQVKKGQLLAELDKMTLNEKLNQANASLLSAQSDLTYAQQNYNRTKLLFDEKAATQASLEDAANRLAQAKTSVANSSANLHQAKVNLSYAEIYSPINGVVLDRAVEQGQTVAASFNTPTLFTIANDLTKMQVEANVDEADIGKVKVGQKVSFTVDAYNDDVFNGKVSQIRMQPSVTNNVVTYTVVVEAPNPDEKLFPGMTANITIIAQTEKGLTIPAAAFSFKPAEEIAHKLKLQALNPREREVCVVKNGVYTNVKVKTGLTDGVNTIIASGLNKGEEVVLSATYGKKKSDSQQAVANPLMPKRPGGGGMGGRR